MFISSINVGALIIPVIPVKEVILLFAPDVANKLPSCVKRTSSEPIN